MDRVVFVAGSGAKQLLHKMAVNTHNLANANTVGFQADMVNFRAQMVSGAGHDSRAYVLAENGGVSGEKGTIQSTGRTLDVAVNGNGWLAVQSPDGSEGYTRAGNLRVNINGQLVTSAGHPVLGASGPVVIPEYEKLEIGGDGTVSVRPIGQTPATLAEVSRLKIVSPSPEEMVKGEDGLLHMRDGSTAPPSTEITLTSGALEFSNVNGVEAMVDMIALARQYEMTVKIMSTSKEMDEKATQLMNLG